MLDIREGDLLVVGAESYPIRSAAQWTETKFSARTFSYLASVTASTKRNPAIASGKRGDPVTNLASVKCMPLDPLDPEVRQRLGLDTPHELLHTYASDGTGFVELVIEDLKR